MTLKLEIGKYYRTRDGRKVGPLKRGGVYRDEVLNDGNFGWWPNGGYFDDGSDNPLDLIAEWTDTPEVGTLSEIGAKVGDVVEAIGYDEPTLNGIYNIVLMGSEPCAVRDDDFQYVETSARPVWRIISRAQPQQDGLLKNIKQAEEWDSKQEILSPGKYAWAPSAPTQTNRYSRIIKGVEVDLYDLLDAYNVTCPARQHAIKKLFMAGQRGAKDVAQDLEEARQAVVRAGELVNG